MLSEHDTNLLIDFVDGALTGKERDAAEQMMRESSEARKFVRALKANADKLKNLPRHKLGAEFTLRLMATLPSTAGSAPGLAKIPQPVPPATAAPVAPPVHAPVSEPAFSELAFPAPKRRLRRGMPAWAVGGIVASVIGILLFGSLAYLRNMDHDRDLLPPRPGHTPQVRVKPPVRTEVVDQLIAGIVRGAGERYGETKVEIVRPKPQSQQPVRFAFGDLKNQDKFDYLKWELAHATDVHLDITVKYNARSLNRVIESFEKHGMRLVVTRPAEESAAKKQPLLVYCENVQPDRLALALRDLSEIDVQGKEQQPSTFDAVKVSHGTADDHKLIAQGLGIDPRQLKSPQAPVAQVTPMGVVLPAEKLANPSKNGEILSFLNARGPVQIGALQVFVRIEHADK